MKYLLAVMLLFSADVYSQDVDTSHYAVLKLASPNEIPIGADSNKKYVSGLKASTLSPDEIKTVIDLYKISINSYNNSNIGKLQPIDVKKQYYLQIVPCIN